jgi:hypothetical protein
MILPFVHESTNKRAALEGFAECAEKTDYSDQETCSEKERDSATIVSMNKDDAIRKAFLRVGHDGGEYVNG